MVEIAVANEWIQWFLRAMFNGATIIVTYLMSSDIARKKNPEIRAVMNQIEDEATSIKRLSRSSENAEILRAHNSINNDINTLEGAFIQQIVSFGDELESEQEKRLFQVKIEGFELAFKAIRTQLINRSKDLLKNISKEDRAKVINDRVEAGDFFQMIESGNPVGIKTGNILSSAGTERITQYSEALGIDATEGPTQTEAQEQAEEVR